MQMTQERIPLYQPDLSGNERKYFTTATGSR